MSRTRRLVPHAVGTVIILALVVGWDWLGVSLPALDALLAPGGASPGALLGVGLVLALRGVGVLVLPGLLGVLLLDAALVSLSRDDGEQVPG